MTADRTADRALEKRVPALLDDALDQPSPDREAFVHAHCGDDTLLANRTLALVRAGEASHRLRTGGGKTEADDAPLPARIGAYRITGLIGQGGMGAVYRGERATGDFDHIAAIKVVRPGALSDVLVERFQRERQILAQLSHPNIARLFDGGQTDAGDPYIVMEWIDGPTLDTWLARGRPLRSERIALFLAICSAVGFAHQNLIVHRDLTPSNILVTADGTPKLIDFGIARPAAANDAPPGPARPKPAGVSLTPGFAAPERRAGGPATTLSDVYSLGLLFRQVCGNADADADADAIVKRATAFDPADRYPSVDALADDVIAWRDGGVVAARGGGRHYALGKFVARHRFAVGGAATAMMLILVALAMTVQAYARAEAARSAEQARFEEVRSLASFMLFDLNGRMARVVGNADARMRLANRAQRYLSALAASPGTSVDLKLEAARGLVALARIQGVPTQVNLGQTEAARANLRTAIAMVGAAGVPQRAAAPIAVEARALLAMIEAHADADVAAADRTLARAAGDLQGIAPEHRTTAWFAAQSRLRKSQFELAVLGNRLEEMARLADLIDAEVARWPAALRISLEAAFDRATAMHYRAIHGYLANQLDAGFAASTEADRQIAALDRARANDPATLYLLAFNAYVGSGTADGVPARRADADRFLATARRSVDRLLAIEPGDRALQAFAGSVLGAEAQALGSRGQFRQAIATQRRVVELFDRATGPERKPIALNRLAIAHVTLANIGVQAGDRILSCESTRAALALVAELKRRGLALGSVARFEAGLTANAYRCAPGRTDALRALA